MNLVQTYHQGQSVVLKIMVHMCLVHQMVLALIVLIYYSGASQEVIYPTLTASFYSPQGGFWGINLHFDTSKATTGVQWTCSVDYQVTITEDPNPPETYRASFYMTGHCDEFGKIEVDDYDDGEGGTTISQVKVEGWTTVFVRSSRVLSQTASMEEDDINIRQQPN